MGSCKVRPCTRSKHMCACLSSRLARFELLFIGSATTVFHDRQRCACDTQNHLAYSSRFSCLALLQQVVDAMRTTVTNLLGTLPPSYFHTQTTANAEDMAQMMYSIMMTGYMYRNGQYRMELDHLRTMHGETQCWITIQARKCRSLP